MIQPPVWLSMLAVACSASTLPPEDASRSKPALVPSSLADDRAFPGRPTAQAVTPSVPSVAPPARNQSAIGTGDPTVVGATAPSRHWVVLCQARRDTNGDGLRRVGVGADGELAGDDLAQFLIEADGEELEIDQYLSGDPSGRYVAIRIDERTLLRDTIEKRSIDLSDLGLDASDDGRSYTPHRSLSFDPLGQRLAYLSTSGHETKLVLRDLRTGAEDEMSTGAGAVGRIEFEPDARFIRLDVVTVDTNGNGRLQGPFPIARAKRGPCPGPVPRYNVWQFPGDQAQVRLFDVAGRRFIDVPDFVMTVGADWITRNAKSELWLQPRTGLRRKISSESCAGRVLHTDAENGTIVFGCASAHGARRELFVRTPTQRRRLGFDIAGYEIDSRFEGQPRWLSLYPRDDTVLLDSKDGEAVPLNRGTRVLATFGNVALVDSADGMAFVRPKDTDTPRTEITLTGTRRPRLGPVIVRGRFASLGQDLYDLAERSYVGSFQSLPLALSSDGMGLIAHGTADDHGALALAVGPLEWRRPAVP